ncbi:MAG: hypothetical protein ACMG6S_25670, partial [Byssovorax sp.]
METTAGGERPSSGCSAITVSGPSGAHDRRAGAIDHPAREGAPLRKDDATRASFRGTSVWNRARQQADPRC